MPSKVARIQRKPPEPTKADPYVQLDWLCERFVRRYDNEATKKHARQSVKAFKNFLGCEAGYDERLLDDPRFYLSIHCDSFVLYNVEQYWRAQGHTSHSRASRVGILQRLFHFAAAENLTPTTVFFYPRIGRTKRETSLWEAYETKELELIWNEFRPVFDYARRIAAGYKRTDVGADPRRYKTSEEACGGSTTEGLKSGPTRWSWEGFVWYFENELHCKPVLANLQTNRKHWKFFNAACKYYGSIKEVWRLLGVTPLVDIDLILPLAMKLCWETGLNAESLLSLRRDCLQESHPLTGQPYLRYYKERSTGEKHLHLHLLDPPGYSQIPLLRRQSAVVRQTIELILKLTAPLVGEAKQDDKDLLLIYQARITKVIRLRSQNISRWAKPLLRKLKEEGNEHVPIHLNLVRFRPSRITQMAREGRDFFEIQAVAGHANAYTTFEYLSERQIAPKARREVSTVLRRIHENREEFEHDPKNYATAETQGRGDVVYKGLFCDCKNVYDPPQSVRGLPSYREGQPCTYFNMCLTCPNIIITKKHLPTLLNYKSEIEESVEGNNLANVPNASHYETSLAVLDGILLEFDEADVTWAREIAECADILLDPVTHRAVDE